jgi:hypothetical protein
MISVTPIHQPPLDPGFIPAALWNRAYQNAVTLCDASREVRFAIERRAVSRWIYDTKMLPDTAEFANDNLKYAERLVKSLLWAWGGLAITDRWCPGDRRRIG